MYSEPPSLLPHGVSVRALLDDSALGLNVRLVGGAAGLGREIRHPRIQKSGLALVGHVHGVNPPLDQAFSAIQEAESVIVRPLGDDKFEVVGRVSVDKWALRK